MKDAIRVLERRGWTHLYRVIKNNWRDYCWWRRLIVCRVLCPLLFRKNNGAFVLEEEEFDNLIILDACRYDFFEEEIKGFSFMGCTLKSIVSRASHTRDFLFENFQKTKFKSFCKEIVYVTANPFVNREMEGKFYKIIPVWKFGWDTELLTVLPRTVFKASLQAAEDFPGKKLVIHFIQPHHPFIKLGSVGSDLSNIRQTTLSGKFQKRNPSIWTLLKEGKIARKTLLWGYRQNLKIVLPYVEKLCRTLPGKTIITADHGEAMGERIHPLLPIGVYGHLPKVRIESLTKVPWLLCDNRGGLGKVEREITRLRVEQIAGSRHRTCKPPTGA